MWDRVKELVLRIKGKDKKKANNESDEDFCLYGRWDGECDHVARLWNCLLVERGVVHSPWMKNSPFQIIHLQKGRSSKISCSERAFIWHIIHCTKSNSLLIVETHATRVQTANGISTLGTLHSPYFNSSYSNRHFLSLLLSLSGIGMKTFIILKARSEVRILTYNSEDQERFYGI